jgi:general L-amino acid transport system substrate-binding protein
MGKILAVMLVGLCCVAARAETTLAKVRAAGALRCGIDVAEAEYSTSDDHGGREAFDGDLCRAVAVAVLGLQAKALVTRYPDDRDSMKALTGGEVDLVATLTDDFAHAAGTGIGFTRPVLWDGVGFLVLGAHPSMRARQLSGRKICFLAQTTVEESARAWFGRERLNFVPFPFQEEGEMDAAFTSGNCGALAGDRTRLAEARAALLRHGRRTTLLPERVSKDPLAAAYRDDDAQWATIVNWVMEALVQAEESGVNRGNIGAVYDALTEKMPGAGEPELRTLLGISQEVGNALGLKNDWVIQVIRATGNYGEIYERDLGSGSALKLPRDANELWKHGGLMIALPPK